LAKTRNYSPQLVDRLNQLALRAHQQLYARRLPLGHLIHQFLIAGFPRQVRREWRFVFSAIILFWGSALVSYVFTLLFPELIYSIMDPASISSLESAYDPSSGRIGTDRPASTDVQMFGYYIQHNIGIGFRTFASGIFAGIGSCFFLLFNGVMLGSISAHMTLLVYTETFFSFVIGHGSVELTAIVISGAAGIKIGYSLIAPGPSSRQESLRHAALESMPLVYGVIVLLLLAAGIEAFWSSKGVLPSSVKFAVGGIAWAAVLAYFSFAGKGSRHGA
jgi:uncharacterized membrane protein SpoIIM required for sporulation